MKKNVYVICGGPGNEHEVSLKSAKSILTSINKKDFFLPERFKKVEKQLQEGDRVVCIKPEVVEQWCLKKNAVYTIDITKISHDKQHIIHINVAPTESVGVGVWFLAVHFKKIPERQILIYKQFEEFSE